MTFEAARPAARFFCAAGSSFFQSSLGARSRACARKPQSTSGCWPSWKLRKSGDCGSAAVGDGTARQLGVALLQVALRTRIERRFEPRRNSRQQPPDGFQVRDLAAVPSRSAAMDSTGMLRLSVPAARLVSTGSATRASVRTQYWRSLSLDWEAACAATPSPATV